MLHLVAIVVVPGFLALAWWQLDRALGGNGLSWAYVFEWPFFAGYAVFVWWRLVHDQRHRKDVPSLLGRPEVRPAGWALAAGGARRGSLSTDRHQRRAERRAARPTVAELAALAVAEATGEVATLAGAMAASPDAAPPPAAAVSTGPLGTGEPGERVLTPSEPADSPPSDEDRALAEYNDYLAALSASGRRKRW